MMLPDNLATDPATNAALAEAYARVQRLFAARGWTPFPFQQETWAAYLRGESGLLHAPTGVGKTFAVWLGPLLEWMAEEPQQEKWVSMDAPPLRVLWVTPLRALAADTLTSLHESVAELGVPWRVEGRTGDTAATTKKKQKQQLPSALVTTPESLSVMLSYPESQRLFSGVRAIIVDEWHELLGTKRGVQTELALARLRAWSPAARVWGLSATLGNLVEAAAVLLPNLPATRMITAAVNKEIVVETLIPETMERFPWAGHLGLHQLPRVLDALATAGSTLIFTNTRAQTEIWFQMILDAAPAYAGEIALHHGSLERELRSEVEARLRDGRLRVVVCTSSLDLGVDFSPVDQVIQIGSPKGVARLMQRAGRAGHRPGVVSRILCVPTHAFELVEFAAVKWALAQAEQAIEARVPLQKPLDLLVQHLVTVALGGGFTHAEMLAEVRTTYAYRELSAEEFAWALAFVTHGGVALRAYAQFAKVVERDGRYSVESREVARFHRMMIGSITSDAALKVALMNGARLGTIEESFIARLRKGDRFVFAGRILELVMVKEMTAFVKRARSSKGIVPRWSGGRMPLSSQVALGVRVLLDLARQGVYGSVEVEAVRPLLELQMRWSILPAPNELLIEQTKSKEGYHTFLFPLAGRLVHEGLAAVLAWRITRRNPSTISAFATDYGVELASAAPLELTATAWRELLSTDRLLDDILECVNASELARRQFRDIARIAGLIFPGYPGSPKGSRQLQASSSILFEVFADYDPENLLLLQARREVLEQQLEVARLRALLENLAQMELRIVATRALTPLAFPLWADRMRSQEVSTESWEDRVRRMVVELEVAAG